jgi:toxin FitB
MMRAAILIDTNIVSELARRQPDRNVIAFITAEPRLRVSVMLFHELVFGLEQAREESKIQLTAFIQAMRLRFGAKAIPVDLAVAETAGRLRAFEKTQGRVLSIADSIMAATAMNNGLPLATRNVKDFKYLGVEIINPFEA